MNICRIINPLQRWCKWVNFTQVIERLICHFDEFPNILFIPSVFYLEFYYAFVWNLFPFSVNELTERVEKGRERTTRGYEIERTNENSLLANKHFRGIISICSCFLRQWTWPENIEEISLLDAPPGPSRWIFSRQVMRPAGRRLTHHTNNSQRKRRCVIKGRNGGGKAKMEKEHWKREKANNLC